MASQLLPPPPTYEKKKHPDDLLSEGGSLEARAVALAARRFFGGERKELFGPALVFAVRTPFGYLSATRDGRVSCNGIDPAAPECAFLLQKGGIAAHFRITFRSVVTDRRLKLDTRTCTISATGGTGDGEAPDDEKFMFFNYEDDAGGFPCDSMSFRASRDAALVLCAQRPDRLCLDASGTAFYLVDPSSEQKRVNELPARQALREQQAAAREAAVKQEYADRLAALRIAERAEAEEAVKKATAAAKAAEAGKAAAERAELEKKLAAEKAAAEKLAAELEVARKQAEKAQAQAAAARQEADRVAAARAAENKAAAGKATAAAGKTAAQHADAKVTVAAAKSTAEAKTIVPNAIYIPQVPPGCTTDQLKSRFATYGKVTNCTVHSHNGGAHAFIEFKDIEGAEKAQAAKGVMIDKVPLSVKPRTVVAQPPVVVKPSGSKQGAPASASKQPLPPASAKVPLPLSSFQPEAFPPLDAPRNDISEHAENLALRYMIWLGFYDSKRGGHINEPDGGIDISSTLAVAQVKALWHGKKVPRPMVQEFTGACSSKEHVLKGHRLFFAPLYSAEAVAYADEQRMKLFTFNSAGEVNPENVAAKELLAILGKT